MKTEFSLAVTGPAETMLCGEIMGKMIPPGSTVGLSGDLGAGKTVFTKGIARGLGTEREPNSPTFVIMNGYEGETPLFHFDAYRLSGSAEFEDIGYEEFFYGDGVAVVEWAEKISDVLPADAVIIDIRPARDGDENSREIRITGGGKWLLSFRNTAERALLTSRR